MNQAFPMTTDVLENKDLRGVFRRHKTEMACMENPRTFLLQLRDYDLLPDDRYQVLVYKGSSFVITGETRIAYSHIGSLGIVSHNKHNQKKQFIDSVSLQDMRRMRSKDNLKKAIYEFLDWLEVKQPRLIPKFWRAIFKEITMTQYPTLRRLHYSLMNGQSYTHLTHFDCISLCSG